MGLLVDISYRLFGKQSVSFVRKVALPSAVSLIQRRWGRWGRWYIQSKPRTSDVNEDCSHNGRDKNKDWSHNDWDKDKDWSHKDKLKDKDKD